MNYIIYLKLTNRCNLNCQHCYNSIMNDSLDMSHDILIKSINWINKFKLLHPSSHILVVLHGGEPLLYNLVDINYLLDSLDKIDNVNYSATTNLCYELNDSLIKILFRLSKYDGILQTSYDIGKLRFKCDELKSLWKSNVKYLINLGIDVQPTVCLSKYLISSNSIDELTNLIDELNIHRLNFERLTKTGNASINDVIPSNAEVDSWMIKLYKHWESINIKVPLFESIERSLNGEFLGCRERKCMQKVVTINPDGSISGCPNTANIKYSSVDNSFNDLNIKNNLIYLENSIDSRCLCCEYFKYCNGDCCQLSWDDSGCPGLKSIYKYLLNRK